MVNVQQLACIISVISSSPHGKEHLQKFLPPPREENVYPSPSCVALRPYTVSVVGTRIFPTAGKAATEDLAVLPPVELVCSAGSMDAVEGAAEDAIAVSSTRLLRMRAQSPT